MYICTFIKNYNIYSHALIHLPFPWPTCFFLFLPAFFWLGFPDIYIKIEWEIDWITAIGGGSVERSVCVSGRDGWREGGERERRKKAERERDLHPGQDSVFVTGALFVLETRILWNIISFTYVCMQYQILHFNKML